MKHKIDLTTSEPPKSRLYRVSPKHGDLRDKIDDLLEDDFQRLSTISFGFGAILN